MDLYANTCDSIGVGNPDKQRILSAARHRGKRVGRRIVSTTQSSHATISGDYPQRDHASLLIVVLVKKLA
jgi:hypothetical protein